MLAKMLADRAAARLKADKKWALWTDPSPIVTNDKGLVALLPLEVSLLRMVSAIENPRALPTAGGH